jgi:large subunit ribosomal protein L4
VELQVRNIKGNVIGSIEVRDDVFAARVNQALIHQVMVGQLANRRQGTAKTKTRAEASGGGAKPRPQKHTGRARAGSTRSPIWKGGGVAFGPRPRSYRHHTPKRMRRGALISTLSGKAQEGSLVVVDDFDIGEPKTKAVAQALSNLGAGHPALLVADGAGAEVLRAARNVPRLKMQPSHTLNVIDLLNHRTVIITVRAVRNAESIWGGRFERGPSADLDPEAEPAMVGE